MSNPTSASAGLSGRELARERRKAMSRNGKAAVKGSNQGVSRSQVVRQNPAPAAPAPEPAPSAPESGRESDAPAQPEPRFAEPRAERQTDGSDAPPPGAHQGASNGRQAALERRQKMARQGKKALGRGSTRGSGGFARAGSERSRQLEVLAQSQDVDCENMSGREICRLRRQALAQNGKKAMATEPRREDRLRGRERDPEPPRPTRPPREAARQPESPAADESAERAGEALDQGLDRLCEQVEQRQDENDREIKPMISDVRAICMARRDAMASQGKKALRRRYQAGTKRPSDLPREGSWKAAQRKGMTTREIARQRRQELCSIGRGSSEPGRPCGRPRHDAQHDAPPKVEEGTTLSGGHVSGTQVESTYAVTGGEAGSCYDVTGTEYLGAEHFDRYCGTLPEAHSPKVGHSHTSHGQQVSGAEVGRSRQVTGDERGSCEAITGTEYLSTEQYEGFCGTRPAPGTLRTGVMHTGRGEDVSGTTVGRSPKVTGDESGSCRSVTGTEYLNTRDSEVPCTGKPDGAPARAGVMHTLRGRELTGTDVGRSSSVTGVEHGDCKPVTGTEYLGSEDFQRCGTRGEPAASRVSEMHTAHGRSLTGVAVDRSPRVTGDETGSCASLTGTPYYNRADFAELCEQPAAGGVHKVGVMHTLHGGEVSGTRVESSSRITGDEYGGCKPITGTEYVGSDHYETLCGTTPEAGPDKVTMSRTWKQQGVSGPAMGPSSRVTGDEYGACKPISGTSYVGPDQYQQYCAPEEARSAGVRVAQRHSTPGHAVSGSQPGYDDRVTGTEHGACQDVSGAPYVGADEFASTCANVAGDLHPRLRPEGFEGNAVMQTTAAYQAAPAAGDAEVPAGGFSVPSPAREARERRVTGTAYGSSGSITGSVNKAVGLVSGTEEFRYGEARARAGVPMAMAQAQARAAMAEVEAAEQDRGGAERVTVNGAGGDFAITGDDWQRGESVTGTEGFSTRRNVSMRGNPRGEGSSAWSNRELERKEVPASRITGSSGSTDAGSLVTLSGGARG
ncbi:CsoS2 family carboxysome shell protein [Thioalkalivibrio sp. ALE23]|uniref:CsoS2 family carboxysome shell protein n=1 Tax=Thioalkalivibrio sp. ALE23 TaxID=1265495 RepID=UPI00037A1B3C|nr:CsoS2 family carboxysome shell protein [Thioalkalivibrio sp. ALE23]